MITSINKILHTSVKESPLFLHFAFVNQLLRLLIMEHLNMQNFILLVCRVIQCCALIGPLLASVSMFHAGYEKKPPHNVYQTPKAIHMVTPSATFLTNVVKKKPFSNGCGLLWIDTVHLLFGKYYGP